jgi:hypothetical protein
MLPGHGPDEPAVVTLPALPEEAPVALVAERYAEALKSFKPVDDITLKASADLIAEIKETEKRYESRRVALVKPLNDEVDRINKAYKPGVEALGKLWRGLATMAATFIEDRRREAERKQQEAIAAAAKKRAEEEAKAEAARRAAEEARAKGNEKEAVKLESKAEQAELKAAHATAPVVEPLPAKSVDLGGANLSFGTFKPTWVCPGWDGKKALWALDDIFKPILGDITKLSPELQWFLAHCEVSPVRLNASVKTAKSFPSPFTITKKPGATTLRGGKE